MGYSYRNWVCPYYTDDDTDLLLGWRLTLPSFLVSEMGKRYEVHARKEEETGDYIVGVRRKTKDEPVKEEKDRE